MQPSVSSQGSNSSILVSWTKPRGVVEYYMVHLNDTVPKRVSSNNTSWLFEDLSAGRLYTAIVTTFSGPFNASSEFVTNATCKYLLDLKVLYLTIHSCIKQVFRSLDNIFRLFFFSFVGRLFSMLVYHCEKTTVNYCLPLFFIVMCYHLVRQLWTQLMLKPRWCFRGHDVWWHDDGHFSGTTQVHAAAVIIIQEKCLLSQLLLIGKRNLLGQFTIRFNLYCSAVDMRSVVPCSNAKSLCGSLSIHISASN